MQLDVTTLVLISAGIAVAVLIAVLAGTLAARLFFHASGLAREDVGAHLDKPGR